MAVVPIWPVKVSDERPVDSERPVIVTDDEDETVIDKGVEDAVRYLAVTLVIPEDTPIT